MKTTVKLFFDAAAILILLPFHLISLPGKLAIFLGYSISWLNDWSHDRHRDGWKFRHLLESIVKPKMNVALILDVYIGMILLVFVYIVFFMGK